MTAKSSHLLTYASRRVAQLASLVGGLLSWTRPFLQKMAPGLKGKVVHVKIVVLHLFPTEIAAEANFKLVVFLNFTTYHYRFEKICRHVSKN